MTAQEIYQGSVTSLPKAEKIRLAALILQELSDWTNDPGYSEEWTEEDVVDLTAASLRYADERYPQEDNLV